MQQMILSWCDSLINFLDTNEIEGVSVQDNIQLHRIRENLLKEKTKNTTIKQKNNNRIFQPSLNM